MAESSKIDAGEGSSRQEQQSNSDNFDNTASSSGINSGPGVTENGKTTASTRTDNSSTNADPGTTPQHTDSTASAHATVSTNGGASSSRGAAPESSRNGTENSNHNNGNGNGGSASEGHYRFRTGPNDGWGRADTRMTGADPEPELTLGSVMRAPGAVLPDVVVLDEMPEGLERKEVLDPREDLWLSTADGRYSSPMIPLTVGVSPYMETFYVHKHILIKAEYFEKALCGDFHESRTQSINLPEEDPAIFHFLIAYLYEGRYDPIKPMANVLIPDDKGKSKDTGLGPSTSPSDSENESDGSYASDPSVASRRRREHRRRREDRHWERIRQKHPGFHRPNCTCPQCAGAAGPPCWNCLAPRVPPPPPPMPGTMPGMVPGFPHYPHHHHGAPVVIYDGNGPYPRDHRRRRVRHIRNERPAPPGPAPPAVPGGRNDRVTGTRNGNANANTNGASGTTNSNTNRTGRISDDDMRTWLLAYGLHMDVYILANKFLLDGFKRAIARAAIDMLETAGPDAAVPEVLYLCRKLYEGLPLNDPLLKMVFARVGFLQPWRAGGPGGEAEEFLVRNPEVAALLLREMAARREEDFSGRSLPSMERAWTPGGVGPGPGPRPGGMDGWIGFDGRERYGPAAMHYRRW